MILNSKRVGGECNPLSPYHFKAVQVSCAFTKENHKLYLALCPLCAAKYRYLVKKDYIIMDNFIASAKEAKENFEIPIELRDNGSHSIRFVETHLLDLKTILENQWNEKRNRKFKRTVFSL